MTRLKILLPENLEAMEHYIEQEKPKLVAIDALKSLSNSWWKSVSLFCVVEDKRFGHPAARNQTGLPLEWS